MKKTHIFVKKIRIRRFKIRCLISLEHVTRVVEAFADGWTDGKGASP